MNNIHKTTGKKMKLKNDDNEAYVNKYTTHNITNLTSHDLVMESIKKNSFIILTFHTLILCIENTFKTQIYWKM